MIEFVLQMFPVLFFCVQYVTKSVNHPTRYELVGQVVSTQQAFFLDKFKVTVSVSFSKTH